MSKETYSDKINKISVDIFRANYHQEPVDQAGRLYGEFKTYTSLEALGYKSERVIATIDTADEGNDYLACIIADIYKGQA